MLHRIKKRADFVRAAQNGASCASSSIVLQAIQTPSEQESGDAMRVGFTVTKKVGNAVIRNRVKRRMRAAAYELLPRLGKTRMDYVLIGRKACVQCSYETIIKDLTYALDKVHRS